MKENAIGLALGGGAARGWAHIGVLRVLSEAGIEPDIIAGTSIGAVVGGCYAAGALDAVELFARGLTWRRVFGYLDFNLAGTGLITGQRLFARLEETLGDRTIESLDRPFTAIATEIGTGNEIWLSRGKLVDAICASYALPGVFRPIKINGRWLFDGALVNPIPVSVCRAFGARYVIAVNLNGDVGGRGSVVPDFEAQMAPALVKDQAPIPAVTDRSMRKLLQWQLFGRGSDAPGISSMVFDAFSIVQDRISRSRLAGDPPDALITPKLAGIGPFDFHRADELIQRGTIAARREIDDIAREIRARGQRSGRLAATA